ncbi:hypothetical protein CRUP_024203, partial [Coryphaenoides rupestris]
VLRSGFLQRWLRSHNTTGEDTGRGHPINTTTILLLLQLLLPLLVLVLRSGFLQRWLRSHNTTGEDTGRGHPINTTTILLLLQLLLPLLVLVLLLLLHNGGLRVQVLRSGFLQWWSRSHNTTGEDTGRGHPINTTTILLLLQLLLPLLVLVLLLLLHNGGKTHSTIPIYT